MRNVAGAAALFVIAAGVFRAVSAEDMPERITVRPFANTYEMQVETGMDLGFAEGERFSGFGGRAEGVEAVLEIGGLTIECRDAALDIRARLGLVVGGRLSCPVREGGDDVAALAARIVGQDGWELEKRHIAPGGALMEGVVAAYDALEAASRARPGEPQRDPLLGWRSARSQSVLELNATIGGMAGVEESPRYELSFAFSNPCLDEALRYQFVYDRHQLDRPEYADLEELRAYYADRAYGEIAWKESTALTHRYVTELCESVAPKE